MASTRSRSRRVGLVVDWLPEGHEGHVRRQLHLSDGAAPGRLSDGRREHDCELGLQRPGHPHRPAIDERLHRRDRARRQQDAVAGATISSTPAAGKYAYADSNGYPTGTTATMADGRAFFINVMPDATTTVTAIKTGVAFKSHALKAHAGALTTTFLTP